MSRPDWYYVIDEETWNALLVADELLSFSLSCVSRTPDHVQLGFLSSDISGFCAALRDKLGTVIGNSRRAQLTIQEEHLQ